MCSKGLFMIVIMILCHSNLHMRKIGRICTAYAAYMPHISPNSAYFASKSSTYFKKILCYKPRSLVNTFWMLSSCGVWLLNMWQFGCCCALVTWASWRASQRTAFITMKLGWVSFFCINLVLQNSMTWHDFILFIFFVFIHCVPKKHPRHFWL